jgi:hypothetical protein
MDRPNQCIFLKPGTSVVLKRGYYGTIFHDTETPRFVKPNLW